MAPLAAGYVALSNRNRLKVWNSLLWKGDWSVDGESAQNARSRDCWSG